MKCSLAGRFFGGCFAVTWTILCTAYANRATGQSEPLAVPIAESSETLADRYFFDAKANAAEQKWVEALILFEKAWELKPSHDIAGNLGQVALKLGRYKLAATFLERCLRLFPPTGNSEQRTQIQALFESARTHVAAVRLHVEPQQGEIVLDRATVLGQVGNMQEPLFVDPGTHIVQIRREARIVAEQSFMAVANAAHDVTVAQNEPNSTATLGTTAPTVNGTSRGQI